MKLFDSRRRTDVPPGYAERSCLLVRYRLPGLPHCFVLCHHPVAGRPIPQPASLLSFFLEQAASLARDAVGDPQAFVLMHNGASIRKRANWHLHVFVVRQRWQKAWVHAILTVRNLAQAVLPAMRSRPFSSAAHDPS